MEIDKTLLKDTMGRPLTQGLFLEIGYNTQFAVYTLKDEDFIYEGKTYYSLKRLYLECEDPGEYDFATRYLANWEAWERLCNNKIFSDRIAQWRKELAIKLRSKGIKQMMNKAETSPMAAKWLADNGWEGTKAGRPSKADVEAKKEALAQADYDFSADIKRLGDFK